MSHGGKVHHEAGGPKISCRRVCGVSARSENSVFERGNRGLSIRLTKGDETHGGGHQISDVTLQEGGQCNRDRNSLSCRTDTENDSQSRWEFAMRERLGKPTHERIGPNASECDEASRSLLCGFESKLRCSAKCDCQFRKFEQFRAIVVDSGAPCSAKEDRLIASRSVAKVRFQPVDDSLAVLYISRFDSPFQAVGIAVRTDRECRRKPVLQPQKCERLKAIES